MKIIEKTIPNIKLLIIGKSSFDQVIKDKVKQNQIEKLVDFIGWIKESDIPNYLSITKLGLSPLHKNIHHDTTYANKVFQYISIGCPVVSSNVIAQSELVKKYEDDQKQFETYVEELVAQETRLDEKMGSIGDLDQPDTYYETAQEAYKHESTVEYLGQQLQDKSKEADPYAEQIDELKTSAVQQVSYDKMNNLRKLQDHQEFMYKLLTSKDSFIRKIFSRLTRNIYTKDYT